MDQNDKSASQESGWSFKEFIASYFNSDKTNADYAKIFRDSISTIGEISDRDALLENKPLKNAVAYFEYMKEETKKKDPRADHTIFSLLLANNIRDQLLEKGPESFGEVNIANENNKLSSHEMTKQ